MLVTKTGQFVNLVAAVDRAIGSGKILYVNPTTVASIEDGAAGAAAASPFNGFEIAIQDADGRELRRFRPSIHVASCDSGSLPNTGIVNEDIPMLEGMKRLVLLHKGVEVSEYTAGELPGDGGNAAGASPFSFAPPPGPQVHRRTMRTLAMPPSTPGISYTVQLKPEGTTTWQTIAVGRPTPEAEIDRNQFPGARAASLRILRSTGFHDEIFSEQTIDLDY